MKKRQIRNKVWAALLAAAIAFPALWETSLAAYAEETAPATAADLPHGQRGILRSISLDASVLRPDGPWTCGGTEVYFGQYGGNPVAYRVLASSSAQTVASDSLLLDCDTILQLKEFDADMKLNIGQAKKPNEWKGSDLEAWLNGNQFYKSSTVFSNVEKEAIESTTLAENTTPYAASHWTYEDYGATDYVFLLSAAEAAELYGDDAARTKAGGNSSWWVRSAFAEAGNGAGSVHGDGHICNNSLTNVGVGLCPALNVNLSSVLFVSASGTNKSLDLTEAGAKVQNSTSSKWKLTLLDPGKTVRVADRKTVIRKNTEAGTAITVPYTYEGNDITQISVMLTDKAYQESGAQVLYYGALQNAADADGDGTPDESGTGTFTLPDGYGDKICGRDYFAYLIAEDVNGAKYTDYASVPAEISIPATESPVIPESTGAATERYEDAEETAAIPAAKTPPVEESVPGPASQPDRAEATGSAPMPWWILPAGAGVVIAGLAVFFVKRKK